MQVEWKKHIILLKEDLKSDLFISVFEFTFISNIFQSVKFKYIGPLYYQNH